MISDEVARRLTAIIAADAVGYSPPTGDEGCVSLAGGTRCGRRVNTAGSGQR